MGGLTVVSGSAQAILWKHHYNWNNTCLVRHIGLQLGPWCRQWILVLVVLIPTFFSKSGGQALGGASPGAGVDSAQFAAGATVLGRDDLARIRASLGRVSDELHLILGVLDEHLSKPAVEWPPPSSPVSTAGSSEGRSSSPLVDTDSIQPSKPMEGDFHNALSGANGSANESGWTSGWRLWVWNSGGWLLQACVLGLDIGIVIGMQVFLESIGRRKARGTVMASRDLANTIALKNNATQRGQSIPTPSAGSAGSTQRLAFLSEEERIAQWLSDHAVKAVVAVLVVIALRIPERILDPESFVGQLVTNLCVMLRCMSLLMLMIRDDMLVPKAEREEGGRVKSAQFY